MLAILQAINCVAAQGFGELTGPARELWPYKDQLSTLGFSILLQTPPDAQASQVAIISWCQAIPILSIHPPPPFTAMHARQSLLSHIILQINHALLTDTNWQSPWITYQHKVLQVPETRDALANYYLKEGCCVIYPELNTIKVALPPERTPA